MTPTLLISIILIAVLVLGLWLAYFQSQSKRTQVPLHFILVAIEVLLILHIV